MIFYNPTDNDILTSWLDYQPKTCFLMTQLGGEISEELKELIHTIEAILDKNTIQHITADSIITGRDFHTKIWKLIMTVPIGIAVLSESMPQKTIANVFYELGLMNALGKETIVIKTKGYKIPSDFVRTEYIAASDDLEEKLNSFIERTNQLADYYSQMADKLSAKPLLTLDYLRRAYLLNGELKFKTRALDLMKTENFDEHIILMAKSFFNVRV